MEINNSTPLSTTINNEPVWEVKKESILKDKDHHYTISLPESIGSHKEDGQNRLAIFPKSTVFPHSPNIKFTLETKDRPGRAPLGELPKTCRFAIARFARDGHLFEGQNCHTFMAEMLGAFSTYKPGKHNEIHLLANKCPSGPYEPGDAINMLTSNGKLKHSAVAIGSNVATGSKLYISMYGDNQPLVITSLDQLKKDYNAPVVQKVTEVTAKPITWSKQCILELASIKQDAIAGAVVGATVGTAVGGGVGVVVALGAVGAVVAEAALGAIGAAVVTAVVGKAVVIGAVGAVLVGGSVVVGRVAGARIKALGTVGAVVAGAALGGVAVAVGAVAVAGVAIAVGVVAGGAVGAAVEGVFRRTFENPLIIYSY